MKKLNISNFINTNFPCSVYDKCSTPRVSYELFIDLIKIDKIQYSIKWL